MKLLPLLCLLSPWFGPGSAQEISDVVTVAEGEDALLSCSLGSKIEKFDWVKDKEMFDKRKEVFMVTDSSHDSNSQDPQFQGRVLFFKDELKAGNASIKIKRTRLEDNGNYTCVLFDPDRQTHIRLNVVGGLKIRNVTGAARKPSVSTVNQSYAGALLECHVMGAYPQPEVVWQDSSENIILAQEPQVTEKGGSYDVVLLTTVTRSGHYYCVVTQKDIKHQVSAHTYVNITDLLSWIIGISVTVVFFLAISALIYFCRQKKG